MGSRTLYHYTVFRTVLTQSLQPSSKHLFTIKFKLHSHSSYRIFQSARLGVKKIQKFKLKPLASCKLSEWIQIWLCLSLDFQAHLTNSNSLYCTFQASDMIKKFGNFDQIFLLSFIKNGFGNLFFAFEFQYPQFSSWITTSP